MSTSTRRAHDSTTRRARLRRLTLEQLETRTPLAGDLAAELPPDGYEAAVKLEIVDLAGNVVTSVKVGEDFRLQARLIVPEGADPFSGYGDFTFLPELVAPVVAATDLGLKDATLQNGEIGEAGRIMYWTPAADLIVSKTFRAMAAGTATFDSNPAESVYLEITYTGLTAPLDVSTVSFGSVELEILASDIPPVMPTPPSEGPRKIDYDLDRVAEEYAQHLSSGSTETFVPSNADVLVKNGHVLIIGRYYPLGGTPGTEEEFAAFVAEMQTTAGVTNLRKNWDSLYGWLPLERIRDLKSVTTLDYAHHYGAQFVDDSLPPPPQILPPIDVPPEEAPIPPVEQPVAEYAATVVIEILNRAGEVVERVNADEIFTVRARLLVTSGADPVAAYVDLKFPASGIVSPLNNPIDVGRVGAKRYADEIKGLGRVMYFSDQPDVIFTKTFQARQPGEVTFATNPGDDWWDEILYVGLTAALPPSLVKFGSVTLQIDAAVPPIAIPPGSQPTFEEPSVTTEPIQIIGQIVQVFVPTEPAPWERGHIEYVPTEYILFAESQATTAELSLSFALVEPTTTQAEFNLLPVFLPATPLRSLPPLVESAVRSDAFQSAGNDTLSNWQLVANPEASTTSADDIARSEPTDDSASESPALLDAATTGSSVKSRRKKN